jgi:hypothetical protein
MSLFPPLRCFKPFFVVLRCFWILPVLCHNAYLFLYSHQHRTKQYLSHALVTDDHTERGEDSLVLTSTTRCSALEDYNLDEHDPTIYTPALTAYYCEPAGGCGFMEICLGFAASDLGI